MSEEYDVSVTRLFQDLKAGQTDAAAALWNAYFDALVRLARRQLGHAPRRAVDEEDVAASVFFGLCHGAAQGRFASLQSRSDLWRVLVCITRQKAIDGVRQATRAKRGGGAVRGESVFLGADGNLTSYGIEQVAGEEPSPSFLVSLAEENERLLGLLRDESLRTVALLRLEGFTNEEIAQRLEISLRSVERKLKLIRERWAKEVNGPV